MDSNETQLLKIKHWTAVVSLLHYKLSLICTLLPESSKKKKKPPDTTVAFEN